jgi:DHA3 family macrolide efflux protein-like MFS transporter
LGSQIVQFALIWWLTQETGSATVLAVASLVGLLPQVLLGPFVGVLVDRWPRRWIMFFADTAVALASILLAFLFWQGTVQIWHVFALMFIRSLGGAFHWPAMQSSTALMVPREMLAKVQGWNQMLQGGLNIISAPLAAMLLAALPMTAIMGLDVLTALFAIVPLLFIAVPQPKKPPVLDTAVTNTAVFDAVASEAVAKPSYWDELRMGLRYVGAWPAMLMLMGMAMLINFLLTPTGALQPLLVTEVFGGEAIQLGLLQAAFGIGIVLGGLLLGVWGGFKKRIHTSLLGLFGLGSGILLMGITPPTMFWLVLVGGLLAGGMMSLTNGPIMAIFQTTIDPAMQGRVLTLMNSAAMAMSPLSLIVAGPFADRFGVQSWYVAGGLLTLAVAFSGLFNRPVLAIEDEREAHKVEDELVAPLVESNA